MTGGMHYTPSHTKVSQFFNFQLAFSQLLLSYFGEGSISLVAYKFIFYFASYSVSLLWLLNKVPYISP